jgi:Spy/CpxP family protein refolding chaperone
MMSDLDLTKDKLKELDLPKEQLEKIIEKQSLYVDHLERCLSSQNQTIRTLIKMNNADAARDAAAIASQLKEKDDE